MSGISHPVEHTIVIEFNGVSFSYGEVKVLENATFHIHQGEFIALIGPNGSGKTTALKLLLGLEQPKSGSIKIMGLPPGRGSVGYVPQTAPADRAFPITVREVVQLGRISPYSRRISPQDRSAAEEALRQTGMEAFATRMFSDLSGGQRRRVLVARALAALPSILILDEPTANMDSESEERLFEALGMLKGNTTILVVTHDMSFVSVLTDRVLCMGNKEGDYTIVQHPTVTIGLSARVLHNDSHTEDRCVEGEGEGA